MIGDHWPWWAADSGQCTFERCPIGKSRENEAFKKAPALLGMDFRKIAAIPCWKDGHYPLIYSLLSDTAY